MLKSSRDTPDAIGPIGSCCCCGRPVPLADCCCWSLFSFVLLLLGEEVIIHHGGSRSHRYKVLVKRYTGHSLLFFSLSLYQEEPLGQFSLCLIITIFFVLM